MASKTKTGDLLYGIAAIADHLGVTKRRALYLKEKGTIPIFYIDSTICSRRTFLDRWLDEVSGREVANG